MLLPAYNTMHFAYKYVLFSFPLSSFRSSSSLLHHGNNISDCNYFLLSSRPCFHAVNIWPMCGSLWVFREDCCTLVFLQIHQRENSLFLFHSLWFLTLTFFLSLSLFLSLLPQTVNCFSLSLLLFCHIPSWLSVRLWLFSFSLSLVSLHPTSFCLLTIHHFLTCSVVSPFCLSLVPVFFCVVLPFSDLFSSFTRSFSFPFSFSVTDELYLSSHICSNDSTFSPSHQSTSASCHLTSSVIPQTRQLISFFMLVFSGIVMTVLSYLLVFIFYWLTLKNMTNQT